MKRIAAVGVRVLVLALLLSVAAAPSGAANTGMFGTSKLDTVSGAEIYRQICQGCHMPDGRGASGAGHYPALARNPALKSPQFMALTIIHGRCNMPAFGGYEGGAFFFSPPSLTDEQIAAVINYVRTHFGNHYTDLITTAQVTGLRPAQ